MEAFFILFSSTGTFSSCAEETSDTSTGLLHLSCFCSRPPQSPCMASSLRAPSVCGHLLNHQATCQNFPGLAFISPSGLEKNIFRRNYLHNLIRRLELLIIIHEHLKNTISFLDQYSKIHF